MADPKKSRGYRNKNPGNIDYNPANRWQGLADPPKEPGGRFAKFVSHEYGIRALAVLLITYQDRHKLKTIRGIIDRWAPSVENNTDSYVHQVSRHTGFTPDQELDVHKFEHLRPLVEAIIKHELGGNPYTSDVIDAGLRLAGVPRPVGTLREAAATQTGRAAVEAAGITGAVAVAVQATPVLSGLQGIDWRVGIAIVVLTAVAIVAYVLVRRKRAP